MKRAVMLASAMLLLAACPYRTRIYTSDSSGWVKKPDGTFELGKEMKLDKAQAKEIDLATLAQDCESGVIAYIDEIRTIAGFNIFTGSRRSLDVLCAVVQ